MSALDQWSIDNNFPAAVGKKVVILSASTSWKDDLLSSIAVDHYGVDNIVWLGSLDIVNRGVSKKTKVQSFKYNFIDGISKNFNGNHKILIPVNGLNDGISFNNWYEAVLKHLLNYNVNLNANNIVMLAAIDRQQTLVGNARSKSYHHYAGDAIRYLDDNPEARQAVNERGIHDIHTIASTAKGRIQEALISNPHTDPNKNIHFPFADLAPDELAKLAVSINKESALVNSWNCEITFRELQPRCGTCKGCMSFKKALSVIGKLQDVEFAE